MVKQCLRIITCFALVLFVLFQTVSSAIASPLSSSFGTGQSYITSQHCAFIAPIIESGFEVIASPSFRRVAFETIESIFGSYGAKATTKTVTEVAEKKLLRTVAGKTERAGLEIVLNNSIKVDAATARNFVVGTTGGVLADKAMKEIFKVYETYKENKKLSGNPLDPCKSVIIRPKDSNNNYEVYDSEACSLN